MLNNRVYAFAGFVTYPMDLDETALHCTAVHCPVLTYAVLPCHALSWMELVYRPDYPNNTKVVDYNKYFADCPGGCLFELGSDPTEHRNMTASNPVRVQCAVRATERIPTWYPYAI